MVYRVYINAPITPIKRKQMYEVQEANQDMESRLDTQPDLDLVPEMSDIDMAPMSDLDVEDVSETEKNEIEDLELP